MKVRSAEYAAGDLVCSTKGRDKGHIYLILSAKEAVWLDLVDGQARRVERPKRKNPKHVRALHQQVMEIAAKLAEGKSPTNAEIRQVIAEFGASREEGLE